MDDITRRLSRWQKKCTPERTKATLDAIYDDMVRRYAAATAELCAMEEKTRTMLNVAGVDTSLYVPYLNFARQLHKLTRNQRISGASFAIAAQVLLEKWAARGLKPELLAHIRTEVFDIGEPAA
jgi:hypothetical protein